MLHINSGCADPAAEGSHLDPGADETAPPSFGQQGLWYLETLSPGNSAYHIAVALDLAPGTHIGVLEQAFQALVDRQAARENELRLDSIQRVSAKPMNWLLKGVPIRGTSIELDLLETNFTGDGDLYLFASILNDVFALYATMNSFTRLTVRGLKQGEVYQWAPRLGRQILA
jgi:type VI secretion system protein ImpG